MDQIHRKDNTAVAPEAGLANEMYVAQIHGTKYEAAMRGRLFLVSTPAAGVTVPIHTNTVQGFVIFNPLGSGVRIAVLKTYIGYVSGTHVAGHHAYGFSTGLQADLATTTNALKQNAFLGAGQGALGRYYSPATFPAAPTYLRNLGLNQFVATAASALTPYQYVDDVDGSIILEVGSALCVAGNAAAFSVSAIACLVEEVVIGG